MQAWYNYTSRVTTLTVRRDTAVRAGAQDITADWRTLGLPAGRKVSVRDLWLGKELESLSLSLFLSLSLSVCLPLSHEPDILQVRVRWQLHGQGGAFSRRARGEADAIIMHRYFSQFAVCIFGTHTHTHTNTHTHTGRCSRAVSPQFS